MLIRNGTFYRSVKSTSNDSNGSSSGKQQNDDEEEKKEAPNTTTEENPSPHITPTLRAEDIVFTFDFSKGSKAHIKHLGKQPTNENLQTLLTLYSQSSAEIRFEIVAQLHYYLLKANHASLRRLTLAFLENILVEEEDARIRLKAVVLVKAFKRAQTSA